MHDTDGAEMNIEHNESVNTVQPVSSSKGVTLSVHLQQEWESVSARGGQQLSWVCSLGTGNIASGLR